MPNVDIESEIMTNVFTRAKVGHLEIMGRYT